MGNSETTFRNPGEIEGRAKGSTSWESPNNLYESGGGFDPSILEAQKDNPMAQSMAMGFKIGRALRGILSGKRKNLK